MLFNSIEFLIFLPVVFLLYWFILNKNYKVQNFFIIIASYLFYGWWDWRFLSLIVFSSFIDYFVGLGLDKYDELKKRKTLLIISICINIGILGVFKYFNFFIDNFVIAFSYLGFHLHKSTLNIVLPVGISFYTFQTLSYSIDVYRNKLKPTKDIIAFFAFVSFFPQLVAGPIERASNLLPQFYHNRNFDYNHAVDGLRQILWGLFKKVLIADNCAVYVNDIFSNYSEYSGVKLLIGGVLFAFLIYGDFSGYSDIAIGTSRLFGFNLMQNFAFPYFSRDIAEFWRRWHISLSTWFRDYVYIPIGGSKGCLIKKIRNVFVIFILSGFWHGANWTYIFWGTLNALYFLPLLLTKTNKINTSIVANKSSYPTLKEVFQMGLTFFLTVIAWIIFRAENIGHAYGYLKHMLITNFLKHPGQIIFLYSELVKYKMVFIFIVLLTVVEWFQRDKKHGLEITDYNFPKVVSWGVYLIIIILTYLFAGNQQSFIYFQF